MYMVFYLCRRTNATLQGKIRIGEYGTGGGLAETWGRERRPANPW
jgi:hypothetical protein